MVNVVSQHLLGMMKSKSSKDEEEDEERVWEKTQDWSNPFDDESAKEQKKKKKRKKKKRSKRRQYTEEELSEMSSQAETLLDDLLGEDDLGAPMNKVEEEIGDDDSMGVVRHGDLVNNEKGTNPFEELEEEDSKGDEIDRQGYNDLLKASPEAQSSTMDPFESDSEADDEASEGKEADDDSTVEPQAELEDDVSIAESDHIDLEDDAEPAKETSGKNPFEEPTERTASNSFDSEEQIEAVETENGVETHCVVVQPKSMERNQTPASDDESSASSDSSKKDESEDEGGNTSDEDIVESSKRLLRMADKRLQYQQHNDEVKKLRVQLETMRMQAEAMSEQLRRAVESKCDLVLAQTEMERCHEQDLIAKDDEIKDLQVYAKSLMEQQAITELNFMNEISTLSQKLTDTAASHKNELMEKDFQIAQLEMKITAMKTEESAGYSAFKSRFVDSSQSNPVPCA